VGVPFCRGRIKEGEDIKKRESKEKAPERGLFPLPAQPPQGRGSGFVSDSKQSLVGQTAACYWE